MGGPGGSLLRKAAGVSLRLLTSLVLVQETEGKGIPDPGSMSKAMGDGGSPSWVFTLQMACGEMRLEKQGANDAGLPVARQTARVAGTWRRAICQRSEISIPTTSRGNCPKPGSRGKASWVSSPRRGTGARVWTGFLAPPGPPSVYAFETEGEKRGGEVPGQECGDLVEDGEAGPVMVAVG